nr:receptor-type tyrosine-protein phosphatase C isoform X2 [Danio rerio]|eukprot:XP_021325270.1 receptor-type tyrosine-protein phosphatase C isoform X2 [Danio rerio]
MARFFAIGPLVLVLCLVLCFGTSPMQTSSNITTSKPPVSSGESYAGTGTTENQEKCRYNIIWNENEAIINVSSINDKTSDHKNQKYRIELKQNNETISNGRSPLTIPLKKVEPCTNYTIHVDNCSLQEKNSFHFNATESKIHTAKLHGDDQVCVEDGTWNLTKCVNIETKDSCLQSPIVFIQSECTYTIKIHMPPLKPEIQYNETIPTKFVWENKPKECNESNFNVHCDKEISGFKVNQDVYLIPSKKYNCIGKYEFNDTISESNNTEITISCDWKNETYIQNLTSSSFEIVWTLSPEEKCQGIKWEGFSGICNNVVQRKCQLVNDTTANCAFTDLKPFTDYSCSLTAKVKELGHFDTYKSFIEEKTKSFHPIFNQTNLNTTDINQFYLTRNSIVVKCKKKLETPDWNGQVGYYIAILLNNGKTEQNITNRTSCTFLFENLSYHTNYIIKITARNKEGNETTISASISTSYNEKAVIGFLAFLIIVTSVALLFVLYKIFLLKRKRTPEEDEICLTQPLRRVEPIYPDGLIDAYRTKIADESRLFMDEFQSIPRIFNNYTIKEAKRPENQSKNRYVDILPYDYNRVTLSSGSYGDYINASFIEGYQEPKKYIAAQGPKDETIVDFWQMMWEQKSSIIVMVTRCEEGNKVKCAQYWPCLDRETEIFDDFVVKIKTEEHCPDYIIRHLVLANKREKASEREITHIQFISWPDHGVPTDPGQLLKLRRRVNSFKNFFSGPIVVHCSAGVGRTGTYIGIDAMIESLEAENRVDIYGFVAKLRRQRCLMVQVEAQYILIHTALIEHNQFGETEILLSEFHSVLNTIREKQGNESIMEIEFQKLPKFKNWRTINTGSSEENKDKNRDSKVIPYDYNRVLFRLDIAGNQTSDPEDDTYSSDEEEEESNEYINASFLDGYWCQKSLIAAQGPLPNTTAEFLLMLYQQQTKTVVMLTDCQEDGKDLCSQYWGDEKKVFGDMEIEVKKTESFPTYVKRHLEIQSTKKNEILELDQYQFLKWKSSELPENAQELIEMIKNIRENGKYDNSKKNRSIPIVVHCSNGSSRTGLFCALWNLMDCSLTEKLVDVFQVVKNLRKERQGMVETFEQYQFLYTALEGAFPVQNGTVKTPAATDSAEIINETPVQINETTALLAEPAAEAATEPANSTPVPVQKETEDGKTESSEPEAKENSSAAASPAEGDSEKNTPEATTNGPAATVEA